VRCEYELNLPVRIFCESIVEVTCCQTGCFVFLTCFVGCHHLSNILTNCRVFPHCFDLFMFCELRLYHVHIVTVYIFCCWIWDLCRYRHDLMHIMPFVFAFAVFCLWSRQYYHFVIGMLFVFTVWYSWDAFYVLCCNVSTVWKVGYTCICALQTSCYALYIVTRKTANVCSIPG